MENGVRLTSTGNAITPSLSARGGGMIGDSTTGRRNADRDQKEWREFFSAWRHIVLSLLSFAKGGSPQIDERSEKTKEEDAGEALCNPI